MQLFLFEDARWLVREDQIPFRTPATFRARFGTSWFLVEGAVTNLGRSEGGEIRSMVVTGSVEALGEVSIDVRG